MMRFNKAFCKYCKAEMGFVNWLNKKCFFTCPKCGSLSPIKTTFDDALNAATCGVFQKPLLPSEFSEDYIWIEYKTSLTTYLVPASIYNSSSHYGLSTELAFIDMINKHNVPFKLSDYNKTWRCWKDKPTNEEREFALWETNHDENIL